jgi:chromosome segregation ATPase
LTTDNQHPRDEDRPTQAVTKLSREELLRRHKEAERKKAITLCRNVIAKHEALEAEQAAKLKETKASLEQAQRELDENSKEIADTQQGIATLRLRKQAVESLMSEYVTKLVDARRALHEHRTQLGQKVDVV